MSFESKSQSSTRSSTFGVIIAAALVSVLVSALVSGIVAVGVTKGWFPIVSIYAAGVPSTVQVIDSVELDRPKGGSGGRRRRHQRAVSHSKRRPE
jgi:hypothetical protein